MTAKQRRVLHRIFTDPVPASIEWADLESLLVAVGCERIDGSGSRMRFHLRGIVATFHRPHPEKEATRYQVRDARAFLERIGVRP